MEWATVLSNIIPNDIAGIECIVGINHREFTFKIKKSIGVYSNFVVRKSKLDKSTCKGHDNCVSLNVLDGDSTYFMWVRKTREFDAQYETAGPVIAAVIFSIMILLLSAILFAYDMFVNKEILQKEIILRTKQLFVRYISHEIRTPINTIHIGLSLLMAEVNELLKTRQRSTHGELLHRSASADAKRIVPEDGADSLEEKLSHWKDMLVDIEMSSAAAIQVLNDLLDYEQIQISRLNMDMSVVSMWTLCESVFWSFRFNLEAKKIKYQLTMELEADSGAPSLSAQGSAAADHQDYLKHMVVFGDPKKLEQVMRNLISNAIKFTHPDGTVTVDVVFVPGVPQHTSDDISSASSNSAVKVLPVKAREGTMKMSVRDSGEGLTAEQQQTLFTAEGVQFNPNRLQDGKGSGLGLWISKGIIKEHKGSIEVTSPGLGQGSTFTVHIPCRYDESFRFVPFEKPKDNSSSMEMSVSLRREIDIRRILLVDDSVPNVKVCRRLLTNAGYEVDVAYNGEECLTRLETENYHLIIIDNHMPVMDGPTAVTIMRKNGYNLPVVGLTGSITPDELRDFKMAGCDDVLCKPLRIQKLNDVLSLAQCRRSENVLSIQEYTSGRCGAADDDKSLSLV
ncbi:evgS [Symbiodinium microadriaticum]|nr:evgS [Symbiodinium microadriaticum]